MSSFPADGAMEAICFFAPRNGSVFPYGAIAERLSSLPVFQRAICRFDASNIFGQFSTPTLRTKKVDDAGGRSASDVVGRVGLGDLAGHSRHTPGRPSGQPRRAGRCGSTVRMRSGLPSLHAVGAPKEAEINRRSAHAGGAASGRTRQRVNPGLHSVSDPTSANRCARPAAR